MNSKLHAGLRYAGLILPLAATLYFAASLVWDVPNPTMALGVLACITTIAYAVLLMVEPKYDGEMNVLENDGVKTFTLDLHTDPEKLDTQDVVSFKVVDLRDI